jgi:hypothetical protein
MARTYARDLRAMSSSIHQGERLELSPSKSSSQELRPVYSSAYACVFVMLCALHPRFCLDQGLFRNDLLPRHRRKNRW